MSEPREEAILCHMHSFVTVRFFTYLFMNDFLPGCLFAVEGRESRRMLDVLGEIVADVGAEV